jgi:hypothetical protein
MEIAPQNDSARIQLLHAALDAKEAHLAINTAQPLLSQTRYRGRFFADIVDSTDEPDELPEPVSDEDQSAYETSEPAGRFYTLPRAERADLLAGIAGSYRQIGEPNSALSFFRWAWSVEPDPARRKVMYASAAELRRESARRSTNAQRAPIIHETLDQNHPVRPRLQASAERKQP